MDNNTQIKAGAIISYLGIIFNIVAGFIYTPWLVKQIGQADYGIYTLAMSVVSFFLMDFGISGAISRFISIYRAEGDKASVSNVLGITYKLYLLIDVIIFIILSIVFCFINQIFAQFTIGEINKLRVVFIIVGTFSLISFPFTPLNGILISYEKFVALKLFELFQKIFSIVFVVIAILFGYGLYAVVLINSLINIFITFFKIIYINKNIDLKVNIRYKDKILIKEIFSFSIWITIITIAQRLIINITPTILGIFSGADQIAIFSIGVTLEAYVYTFSSAIGNLFLPKVTRMVVDRKENDEITNLMIKVGRIQLCIIGIICIGLITMGKEFITLWMGINFKDSYYIALFLILPSLITLTQDIALNYLIAINEIKYRAYDYIATAIISIVLSCILTPKYGAIGAAISAFIGIVLGHIIIMNFIYYKIFNLDIVKFLKQCHLKMAFPMAITFFIGIILQKYIQIGNLVLFFIKALILFILYMALMWLLGLNEYEKNLIKSIIISIKNKIIKHKRRV